MKRHTYVGIALAAVLVIGPATAWFKHGNAGREDAVVADGLTIASHLVSGSGNNIDQSVALTSAITTTSGSPTVTISQTSHGRSTSDKISFYNSTVVGGLNIDGGWVVASTPNANTFTITHTSNANANSGPTGSTILHAPSSSVEDGKLRFLCKFSHLSYDDPILFPGILGATHLHLFFGNTDTNYASTYATLRASGGGTCEGGPLNRTAYWMPAMIDTAANKVRIPRDFQWYYTNDRVNLVERTSIMCAQPVPGDRILQDGRIVACPQYPMKKIERGMRAVMGFKVSASGYPSSYGPSPTNDLLAGAYSCWNTAGDTQGGTTEYRYLHHRTTAALGLSSDVDCPTDGSVQIRLPSPSCWNGSHTGTDGFDHLSIASQDGNGELLCPASHPYPFMHFTVIVHYNYTGGISQIANWHLASDRFNGADFEAGTTFHWDMFWAWNDAIQEHFHKFIHGMFPSPSSATAAGGPYLYSTQSGAKDYVGGPFFRNTNNGGLSGNAGIGDCTALGMAGSCSLTSTYTQTLTDQLVDIPTPP